MWFWDAFQQLPTATMVYMAIALVIAFGFEFVNGFHDTANAVTTVIYTRTLSPRWAVLYSGFLNFMGVLLGGTAIAFTIVNLLPVDLLVSGKPHVALVMVLSILLAGVIWNLGTWYLGLPVSSSHTLIGSILGVGIANSLIHHEGLSGVNWSKAGEVGMALLFSPLVGFAASAILLKVLKKLVTAPRLYTPPVGDDKPPKWIRYTLILTCGGVSYAHGSNDGQKGMGLILLVLIGFLPFHYALDIFEEGQAQKVHESIIGAREAWEKSEPIPADLQAEFRKAEEATAGKKNLTEVPDKDRWALRKSLILVTTALKKGPKEARGPEDKYLNSLNRSIQFVPIWVIFGVALALGVGTTIGYKRIVITVAEKIGKTHLTYGQGAVAELIAAITIVMASFYRLPVSTTHVLSSGVAGTMWANGSGLQGKTVGKIAIAWILTLPGALFLGAMIFGAGVLAIANKLLG